MPVPVTFTTNPPGLAIIVDGSPLLTTPFTTYWDPSVTHSFSTPAIQAGSAGTEYTFVSWSDGVTSPSRTNVSTPATATTYTANFSAQWKLTLARTGSGILIANPPNGVYSTGTQVQITAVPDPYGTFTGFSGALSGTTNPQTITVNGPVTVTGNFSAPPALGFFPVTPCRAVDTRGLEGKTGAFGPPALSAYMERDFAMTQSGCGLNASAHAYSLNVTALPLGPLDFLSVWPTGQPFPGVSTLNSPAGTTIANAALVQASTSGSIAVLASNPTHLIVDANGYFAPPNGSDLAFYPVTPCRVVDTRTTQRVQGNFGPPALSAYMARTFPMLQSSCNIPNTAIAYSLNLTAVPRAPLSFVSIWAADQPYPTVSTLNSPNGAVVANAAIVPAAANGDVRVLSSDPTDLILDINGYFAPPGAAGALHYYSITPCRLADTRSNGAFADQFGPPSLAASNTRSFTIPSSVCGIPGTAQAYALNVTAVPQGALSYLSIWPAGQPYPNVSTLNSPNGTVVANAAIVVAGANGAISVLAGNPTDVILDINGYFAP